MVDSIGTIAGSAYSGYSYPVQAQEDMSAGQTGSSTSAATESLPAVYQPYDLNGDGVLSYSEYQAYLEAMGLVSSSSSTTSDTGETQTVSADTAKAAYQMNSGIGTHESNANTSRSINITV